MRNLYSIILLVILSALFGVSATGQTVCPVMPIGLVCVTQQTVNIAASNSRELIAKNNKIAVLEAALIEKEKNEIELKETSRKNALELNNALTDALVKLGTATGSNIELKAKDLEKTVMIQFLLTNGRKKCNFCVQ